jgi:hypothetical protein
LPDAAGDCGKLPELTDFLRRELQPALSVKATAVDRIERGPGMKLEQFISLLT